MGDAYNNVHKVSAEYKVPRVKKAYGVDILRVCCRTIPQLDNVASILTELMIFGFIMEIGMPLEYSYKMKSLVLFIKPKNEHSKNTIKQVFENCKYRFPVFLIDAEDPSVAIEKLLNELINDSAQEGEKPAMTDAQHESTEEEEEEKPALTDAQNGSTEEKELEACYSRLLFFFKVGILFLSLCLIHHYEE